MLGIKPDIFTATSDHFERMMQSCEDLIRSGDAYADDTDGEKMRAERETRQESSQRNNRMNENFLGLVLHLYLTGVAMLVHKASSDLPKRDIFGVIFSKICPSRFSYLKTLTWALEQRLDKIQILNYVRLSFNRDVDISITIKYHYTH